MMGLPGSIRCSCQEESKDGAPSDRMNNHLLLWLRKSYDISMHTSTRWRGCQFSKNVWKVEQKLLLKQNEQNESLLFKMNHPLSLRMLWDTSQSGHKYSSPITDISLSSSKKKHVHYKAGSSPPRYARQMSSRVLSNINYLTGYFCCCHRDYKVPSKCKNHCGYRQWSQWLKQIRAGVGTHLFGCLFSRTLRPSKQWSLTSFCSDTWKWNPIQKDKLVCAWVHAYTENVGSIGDDRVLCGNFFTSSPTRY